MDPLPAGMLEIGRAKHRGLLESLRRSGASHVCVPYADGLAQVMGMSRLRGSRPFPPGVEAAGLMMRGGFAYRPRGLKQRLKTGISWSLATLAPFDPLFILDPLVFEAVRRGDRRTGRRAVLMPEPVEPPSRLDHRAARRLLRIPEDGRYSGCAGLIDVRKGADQLIRAFASARLSPTDRLLLVGGHDETVRALLAGPYAALVAQERIISIDRFVERDELGAALRAMDVVCALYQGHVGSASLVVRAAAAERPVLGGRTGWVRWAVEKFALGATSETADVGALAVGLERALDASGSFRLTPVARRWLAFNTPENFAATWMGPIRRWLGLPPAQAARTWEWVERD
jgi:glycosyltransferase involved in cell wall biosynthesis